MKLYITNASPFARKCRIVAREKGLMDRVAEIVVDPYASPVELLAVNPIAQVPVLLPDAGPAIADSRMVCEWLDEHGTGPRLLPQTGEARWRVRRVETLAAAALEMGVKCLLEKRRPDTERSPSWTLRWREGMARALDALEVEAPSPDTVDLGSITAALAMTWIGFRHPEFEREEGRPRLIALQAGFEARPSFVETYPS